MLLCVLLVVCMVYLQLRHSISVEQRCYCACFGGVHDISAADTRYQRRRYDEFWASSVHTVHTTLIDDTVVM